VVGSSLTRSNYFKESWLKAPNSSESETLSGKMHLIIYHEGFCAAPGSNEVPTNGKINLNMRRFSPSKDSQQDGFLVLLKKITTVQRMLIA
jgi:hypothetical protein